MIYLITNNVEYLFTYLFTWASVSVKHLFMASLPPNPHFFVELLVPLKWICVVLLVFQIPILFFSVIYIVNALSWFVSRWAMRWAGKGMFPQKAAASCYHRNVDPLLLGLPTNKKKTMHAVFDTVLIFSFWERSHPRLHAMTPLVDSPTCPPLLLSQSTPRVLKCENSSGLCLGTFVHVMLKRTSGQHWKTDGFCNTSKPRLERLDHWVAF